MLATISEVRTVTSAATGRTLYWSNRFNGWTSDRARVEAELAAANAAAPEAPETIETEEPDELLQIPFDCLVSTMRRVAEIISRKADVLDSSGALSLEDLHAIASQLDDLQSRLVESMPEASSNFPPIEQPKDAPAFGPGDDECESPPAYARRLLASDFGRDMVLALCHARFGPDVLGCKGQSFANEVQRLVFGPTDLFRRLQPMEAGR